MELAATAFSSLFATGATTALTAAETAAAVGSAGAAAAPWAAGTTVTAAGGASGALSALQTAATVTSMVSTLFGGVAGYTSHQNQARFAEINAESDRLAAEAESLKIRREYVKRVGDSRVAFAAGGLDISSGGEIEGSLKDQADFETGMLAAGGRMGKASGMAQAESLRSRSYGSLIGAAGDMARYGLGQGLDLRKRG